MNFQAVLCSGKLWSYRPQAFEAWANSNESWLGTGTLENGFRFSLVLLTNLLLREGYPRHLLPASEVHRAVEEGNHEGIEGQPVWVLNKESEMY